MYIITHRKLNCKKKITIFLLILRPIFTAKYTKKRHNNGTFHCYAAIIRTSIRTHAITINNYKDYKTNTKMPPILLLSVPDNIIINRKEMEKT